MKIIYLHQYFVTPAMSGGTRSYELARRLVAAGHEVHVLTSRRDASSMESTWMTTVEAGVEVHWTAIPYSNRMGFIERIRAFFLFAWRAGWKTAQLNGDLVFATSTPLTIALPAVFASRRLKVPMVFEVRDLWPEVPVAMGEIRSRALILLAKWLEKFAYRNSARIVALSPGMADGVVRVGYPRDRVAVIPNASDIELFQSEGENLPPDFLPLGAGPLIVYAGTFGRVNGVGYLVDVAAEMLKLDRAVRFLLVGDGKERDQVESRARQTGVWDVNFWLRPKVRKAQLPALLREATIATSVVIDIKELWHNSANKVFDALAAGRPVMINHGGWQKELLESAGAGFAIPADDPVRAARQIHEFLQSEARVELASQAALRLATTELSRDRLFERFRRVLEEAAASASPITAGSAQTFGNSS